MDRMSATDAGFYFAEGENTPMHVGSVAVFEGPAPSYGDVVRLLVGKLPQVPRYRQRVRPVPLHLGRPLWVDDEHFQVLYHVRHTAVPGPGSAEQLRNLAGRVLGQRLDMAKPLWEVWLVEGLEGGRWALISKVHHCMVDGVAGTDLMQMIFDTDPAAAHPEPVDWTPEHAPSTAAVLAGAVHETVVHPVRQLVSLPGLGRVAQAPAALLRSGGAVAAGLPALARQLATPAARAPQRPARPAPALVLDRDQPRRGQAGPGRSRRHRQRRGADRDHPRLPGPARRARRAVRRAGGALDGAGLGAPAAASATR